MPRPGWLVLSVILALQSNLLPGSQQLQYEISDRLAAWVGRAVWTVQSVLYLVLLTRLTPARLATARITCIDRRSS
jgi:hypothetical protein